MEKITHELQIILSQELNLTNKSINDNSDFKKDLEVDSLDLMSLIVAVEDKFNIRFQQSDLGHIKTFAELRGAVISKLNS